MFSINEVNLIGNLGGDPELRYTPSGKPVVSFSIATSYKYEDKEYTEWHKIEAWGKLAENVNQYRSKGDQVYIKGQLRNQSWEHEGKKYYRTFVKADKIGFLFSKQQADVSGNGHKKDAVKA